MHIILKLPLLLSVIVIVSGCSPAAKPFVQPENARNTATPDNIVPTGEDSIPPDWVFIPCDKLPEQIEEKEPIYPPKAVEEKVEGYVIIKAFVDKNGKILTAKTVKSSKPGYGFEEAALEAAYGNRYTPAENKGLKVGVWIAYRVDFVLDR